MKSSIMRQQSEAWMEHRGGVYIEICHRKGLKHKYNTQQKDFKRYVIFSKLI